MRHDDYTTVTAAAKQFGISPRRLRYLLQRRAIEGIKPTRDWLVRPSAVAAYLSQEAAQARRQARPYEAYRITQPISAIRDAPGQTTATVPEAAAILGLSESHIRNLARGGTLQARKVGRDWVVPVDELTAYRQRTRRGRPPKA
ncbi:MAG: helix-turn-helix domain-containing protein [Dehalococcoidia bacterium]